MFGIIRKTLTIVIVAAGSIVLWETAFLTDLAKRSAPDIVDNDGRLASVNFADGTAMRFDWQDGVGARRLTTWREAR